MHGQLNRRDFMKVGGIGAMIAPLSVAVLARDNSQSATNKPNIVIIMKTDPHNYWAPYRES